MIRSWWRFGCEAPQPGTLALQSGILLLAIPVATYLLAALFLMLHGLTVAAAIGLQIGGFAGAAAFAYAYGRGAFRRSLLIAACVYVLSLVLCRFFVDLSYDGQDYHYTAIWALAQGWDPLRKMDFEQFAAPASDPEPWARHFPKGDWLYLAVEAAGGLGYETAKNSGIMLAAAALLCVYGAMRRIGLAALPGAIIAICAAANPVSLTQLFSRMCDGRLGSLAAIFVSLCMPAVDRREWRYVPACVLALVLAINTKFSMVPVFTLLGAGVCLAVHARGGRRPAAVAGALLAACVLVATFVIGWDPYLRNTIHDGHPFFPVMGKNHIDTMWDSRPLTLLPHGNLTRLAMSLVSATGYEGPHYKIPLTVSRNEFAEAGDPEPRFAGFGPFFLPGLLLATAALIACAIAPQRRHAALLSALASGALLSTLAMPESWLARYVPQFWLFPLLAGTAGTLAGAGSARTLGWLAIALLLLNSGMVGASSLIRETSASMAIHRQIARLQADPARLCANFGGTPARWAMLTDAGLRVAIRDTPPPAGCRDVQPMPYVFFETGDGFGDICHCPPQ